MARTLKTAFLVFAALVISASNGFAFGFPDKYVFSLNGGIDFVNPGQAQTLSLGSSVQSAFTSDSLLQVLADAGVSVAGEWDFFSFISLQVGLLGGFNTQSRASGAVQPVSNAGKATEGYRYDLGHGRLLASGKILLNLPVFSLHPYVSVDFGVAFNGLSNYNQAPLVLNKATLPFKDNTSLSLSYGFGFGIDYDLVSFLRVGGGYHFYDFGPSTFAKANDDPNVQSLSLPHYFGHQLRFQLSVVI